MANCILSLDQEEQVATKWIGGRSMRSIASDIGVSDRTIRNILNRQGAERDHFCPCGYPLRDRDIRLRYCDECRTELDRKQKVEHYQRNLDACKDRSAQWYQDNSGQFKRTNSRWHAANRPKSNAAIKRWKANNPEKVRQADERRRALIFGAFVEDIDRNVVYNLKAGMCGICKKYILGKFHVDHIIPLSRGGEHSYANVQAAHPLCNQKKNAKLEEELRDQQYR